MSTYTARLGGRTHSFPSLAALLAAASPERSGDRLAGLAADSAEARVAARWALAEVPLARFLAEPVIPYEDDDVTRLIVDTHDARAFAPVAGLCVGEFREWLLSDAADAGSLAALAPGLTPEMVAAVSKLMGNADLVAVARKARVVTAFRSTIGLPGRLATRLQPNHPTDDPAGVAAALLDGLLLGSGDAVIGINPATDSPKAVRDLLELLDGVIRRYAIPTQSCVLCHVTTSIDLMERGAPVDLVFQSIAGTQAANASFGVTLGLLDEAYDAARGLGRGRPGRTRCTSRRARAAPCRRTRTTGWTSRRSRHGRTRWPAATTRSSSTRSSASSARSTCTTAGRSCGPRWRTTSAASCSACRWAWTSATRTTPTRTTTTSRRC
ncbi:hypothetical protein SAV31267_046900 [Streptomyces avermitilis]|uniref:Ethanolamine ammonia lyase large subunit n=1 Tax=Streptomyces avermitilis TaxID=33903 RepID=A0A4D4MUT1_STRAX|nr:hypothetical protein SAV31267_046900 [Streptomyces avermitilis]